MRGRGTLVGAPGKVERRERNANAEAPRPGWGGRRARGWQREVEEFARECRAHGGAEIFVRVFPELTRWARLFRTYGADGEMGVHGRSSMEWGTRSVGRSRGMNSDWCGGWVGRAGRRWFVAVRAEEFFCGFVGWGVFVEMLRWALVVVGDF